MGSGIWLHRYCRLVAGSTLLLVIAGGLVTSNDAGLSVPDWPLSYGQWMPPMEGGIFYEHGHRMVAATVGLLTMVLAVWLWRVEPRQWLRRLGAACLAMVIAQGVLGGLTVIFLLPRPVSISHACLAQLFFSATVAMALFTSPSWKQGTGMVEDSGSPPLHWLALAAPVLILAQVALGAAARHKALGVLPHVIGALPATAMALWVALRVFLHHASHRELRRAALALLWITFLQIFSGVGASMSRMATADFPQPMPVMVWFTVAHVAAGALTLASSVVLAIQVFRNVRRQVTEPAPAGARVMS